MMRVRLLASSLIFVLAGACASRGASTGDPGKPLRMSPPRYWEPPNASSTVEDAGQPPATDKIQGTCGNAPGQLFRPEAPWNRPVANAKTAADSAQIIRYLEENHRIRHRFAVDFSLVVLTANSATTRYPFIAAGNTAPDCDFVSVPLPNGGSLEGESGYRCEHEEGDCHLIVHDPTRCRLYESWRVELKPDGLRGEGCPVLWDTSAPYPETGRGEYCSSADASGMPIAPLLFSPDDIYAGVISHAVRFILPNENIRKRKYVRPATHSSSATSAPMNAPPYGSRIRLRASFDMTRLNPAARVLATALRDYGMILVDGGKVTFTATSDRYTQHKWSEVGLGAWDLAPHLKWTDFEVVDSGPALDWNGDCQRKSIQE